MMNKEEIEKLFRRIELDKSNDSCGFEFADGFSCTFDNIATCYDDRLKLYELVKDLQKENKILRENAENNDKIVDKVNWENNILNQRINKATDVIEQMIHKGWGKDGYLYYATGESSEFACRGRRIQQILGGKE